MRVETIESVKERIPSIGNNRKSSKLSTRYKKVNTERVLKHLIKNGYYITDANAVRPRDSKNRDFVKHLIRLSHHDHSEINGIRPEIILINSHNGSSAYKLMFGVYRFACSNGLIVASSNFESVSLRHTGKIKGQVLRQSNKILKKAPEVYNTIKNWGSIELSDQELQDYARGIVKGVIKKDVSIDQLLRAYREADKSNDLWTVFNRIQENTLKGRYYFKNEEGRYRNGRKVKAIDSNVRLNKELWSYTDKYFKSN